MFGALETFCAFAQLAIMFAEDICTLYSTLKHFSQPCQPSLPAMPFSPPRRGLR